MLVKVLIIEIKTIPTLYPVILMLFDAACFRFFYIDIRQLKYLEKTGPVQCKDYILKCS
jgi:hypothetical protein